MATTRRYGRHRAGRVPITFWVDSELKEILMRDVRRAHLPNWNMSAQLDYEVRERRGLWKEPYRPAQEAPSRKRGSAA